MSTCSPCLDTQYQDHWVQMRMSTNYDKSISFVNWLTHCHYEADTSILQTLGFYMYIYMCMCMREYQDHSHTNQVRLSVCSVPYNTAYLSQQLSQFTCSFDFSLITAL